MKRKYLLNKRYFVLVNKKKAVFNTCLVKMKGC